MNVRRWLSGGPAGLLVGLAALVAAPLPGAETITNSRALEAEARMRRDDTFLASDECEGRGPTTAGINKAADYIATEFRMAGLKPGNPDGSYFQPFTIPGATLQGPANLTLKGPQGQEIELKQGIHFQPMGLGHSGKVSGAVVFAGYGLTCKDPAYDDYAGIDVEGKVVILLRETPRAGAKDVTSDMRRGAALNSKISHAEQHKAAAVLLVNEAAQGSPGDDLLDFTFTALSRNPPGNLPVFHVRRSVLERLLATSNTTLPEVEKAINQDLKPHSQELKGWTANLEMQVKRSQDAIHLKNVIGVLEGSGPLAKETVVVGAHYDHLGYGSVGSLARLNKMAIHHGADDNASGTTAVLELARRFGSLPNRQGRRLVFMTYSGEELGLLGSAYYCKNPLFPLADTVAMVNLDMVGRSTPDKDSGKDKVQIYGTDTAKEFASLLDQVSAKHDLKIIRPKVGGYFGASDHFSFYQVKVPVFFFFTDVHPDYHRPTDTSDKINFAGMRRIVDLAEELIAQLASASERPTYVAARSTGGGGRGMGPRWGLTFSDKSDKEGVVVEEVSKGEPAEKAGIKSNDRIVEVGGRPVKNLQDFMARQRGLRSGEPVEVTLYRGEQKMTVKVELPYVVRLGIQPSYDDDKPGVLISRVSDGQVGAKAGLKDGDRIVEIGGKAVKDIEAYMNMLTGLKRGEVLEVTVQRDGKKVTVKIPLE